MVAHSFFVFEAELNLENIAAEVRSNTSSKTLLKSKKMNKI